MAAAQLEDHAPRVRRHERGRAVARQRRHVAPRQRGRGLVVVDADVAAAVNLDRPPATRGDVAPEEERASVAGASEARDLDGADLAPDMANGSIHMVLVHIYSY